MDRMSNKEVNRRTLENFIKSGALDSLPGTRRQKMAVMPAMLEEKTREKKTSIEGQMSLFDIAGEEEQETISRLPFPMWGSIQRRSFWPSKRRSWESTSADILWRTMRKPGSGT